eukprot:CFRG7709T1
MYSIEYELSTVQGVERTDDLRRCFVWIDFPSEEAAIKVVSRAVLIIELYDVWGWGKSIEEAYENAYTVTEERMGPCCQAESTFKVEMDSYGTNLKRKDKNDIIKQWVPFTLKGKVKLDNPEHVLVHIEDHSTALIAKSEGIHPTALQRDSPGDKYEFCVYIGRRVAKGSRSLMDKYRLPDRTYIHTTSMAAELSFISANMAWARPGTMMMDPFAGTGSFMLACAEFGSQTLGSDIDPRVIRGKGEVDLSDNFVQYGTQSQYVGLTIMDFSNLPLRTHEWLDSIVCDPPYGFREGARRVRIGRAFKDLDNKYPLSALVLDLLEFAAKNLRIGGRLVYWLPVMRHEFDTANIPTHPSLTVLYHAEDEMKMGAARHLITMSKTKSYIEGQLLPTEDQEKLFNNYREKMFKLGEFAEESNL